MGDLVFEPLAGKLISFEAIQCACALVARARGWASWEVAPCAARERTRSCQFNVSAIPEQQRVAHASRARAAALESAYLQADGRCRELDELRPRSFTGGRPDAQDRHTGYELHVLKGAATAAQSGAMQLELSLSSTKERLHSPNALPTCNNRFESSTSSGVQGYRTGGCCRWTVILSVHRIL